MSGNGALKVISGNSHVMEPNDMWEKTIFKKWGDLTPRPVPEYNGKAGNFFYSGAQTLIMGRSDKSAKKIGMQAAGWDPAVRLQFQEQAHVAGEMMNATRMLLIMQHPHQGVLRDCASVFNDWLADYCAHDPKRLFGVAMIPMGDVDWAIREVERVVKKGLRVADVPLTAPADGPPYRDKVYDKFWARCQEMQLPVQLHSITGRIPDPLHFHTRDEQETAPGVLLDLLYEAMGEVANEFIFGKILDRFPTLKFILSEFEISWLPTYMWRLDQMQESFAARLPLPKLERRASEYVKTRFWHGMVDDGLADKAIPHIGIDRIIWGSDFPHIRSIGLDAQSRVAKMFEKFPPADRAKLVGGNAVQAYNLAN